MRTIGLLAIGLLLAAAVVCPAQQLGFTAYPIPSAGSQAFGITLGPDGNLWFAEYFTSKIGRITPAGVITEFPTITGNSGPFAITSGPDGNLWFVGIQTGDGNKIGSITPAGVITEFSLFPNSGHVGITAGPDGNLWYTIAASSGIGRITPAGVITEFLFSVGNGPYGITAGPDGNLWFTESVGNQIGRITPEGLITEFPIPTSASDPRGITLGPDGNLWFTEIIGNKIGRITTAGVITEFPVPTSGSGGPLSITLGPDGSLWFTEFGRGRIGRITPGGAITEFFVPNGGPNWITLGPDGNLWFTSNDNSIVKVIINPPDTTPPAIVPTITGTAGTNAWYTSNVTVSWSVTDPESGIASSTGCSATTLTTNTLGTTLTCSATNGANLSNSVSVTIKIDQTMPVIVPTVIGQLGSNGFYTSNVTVSWSATDPESGVASSTGCGSTTLTTNTLGTTLTCSATNGAGLSNSASVTIKINLASSSCDFSPSGTLGPFAIGRTDVAFTPTGGSPPYTFAYAPSAPVIPGFRVSNAPAVPSTYAASQAATLIGLPLNPSQVALTSSATTIRLMDSGGCTVEKPVTLQFTPVDIVAPDSNFGVFIGYGVGDSPQFHFDGVGGTGSYTFQVTGGTFPPGITLNASTGAVSGSFTAAGNFNFTVKLTDGAGNSVSRDFNSTINALRITNMGNRILPNATVNVPYSFTFQASGGTGGPYTFTTNSLLSGPFGLTLSPSGVLSGTPTANSILPFFLSVSDGTNSGGTEFVVIIVSAPSPPLTFTGTITGSSTLPGSQVGSYTRVGLFAFGGVPPYTIDLAPGSSLPPGASFASALLNERIDSSTYVQGRVRQPGSYAFNLRLSDSIGHQVVRAFTWKVVEIGLVNTKLPQPDLLTGIVLGVPYSQDTIPFGGRPPYSTTSSDIPAGLGINSGIVSGTPAETGFDMQYGIHLTDSSPTPIVANVPSLISISSGTPNTLLVGASVSPAIKLGAPIDGFISVDGGATPNITVTIVSGSLPPGLSLLPQGSFDNQGFASFVAKITGTPTVVGLYEFILRATDGAGNIGQRRVRVRVTDLSFVTTSLPNGTVGQPYNQTIVVSGGTPPYSLSISSGSLPAGLSFNASTGLIAGTPTAAGTQSIVFAVTDSVGASFSQFYNLNVTDDLVFVTTSLPGGVVGQPYNQSLVATGSSTPFTFSISSGSLPTGLSLNASTGLISGTPPAPGSQSVGFVVTDSAGASITRFLTLNITDDLVFVTTSLPSGLAGHPYNQSLVATGSFTPFTFSISSGSLPAGLSLNASTGGISGTPSVVGSQSVGFVVTDSTGASITRFLTLNMTDDLVFVTTSLPSGLAGHPYNQSLVATGGFPPFTFSITSGSLPTGLSLNGATGVISGTPSAVGSQSVGFVVIDSAGASITRFFTLNITDDLVFVTTSLPSVVAGQPYNQSLVATGSFPPFTFSISSGSLPAGLSLNGSTGVISGTPSVGVTLPPVRIVVTDSAGASATRSFNLSVVSDLILVNAALANGAVGQPYSQSLLAQGNFPPFTFSIASGTLPNGLSLNASTGLISGTPSATGSFFPTFKVTESSGSSVSSTLALVIGPFLITDDNVLPAATFGQAYSYTFHTSAPGAYTWTKPSGTVPGLSLSSTGVLSGTPTAASTSFNLSVTATSSAGAVTKNFTLYVSLLQSRVNLGGLFTGPLPDAPVGGAFGGIFLNVSGGTPPYTASLIGGSLPPGLSVVPTLEPFTFGTYGLIGTATTAGNYSFRLRFADSSGLVADRTLSMRATGLASVTTSLPTAVYQTPYSFQLQGATSFTLANLPNNALPPGLTLSPTGLLSGTPTSTGSYVFTLDYSNGMDQRRSGLILSINAAPGVTPIGLGGIALAAVIGDLSVGRGNSITINPTGGVGAHTWSIVSGALPPGVSLLTGASLPGGVTAPSAVIAGAPSAPGNYTFRLRVDDSSGKFGVRETTFVVTSLRTLGPVNLAYSLLGNIPAGRAGDPYSFAAVCINGAPPCTYTANVDNFLPAGISLSSAGVLSGTPTEVGNFVLSTVVTDSLGNKLHSARAFEVFPAGTNVGVNGLNTVGRLESGTVGSAYSFSLEDLLTAGQGLRPIAWTVDSGTLPPGLSIVAGTALASATLTGTPTASGDYTFTLVATDATGRQHLLSGNTIGVRALSVAPATLPATVSGAAYSQTLTASGGAAPYQFRLLPNSDMPPGMSLTSAGVLSGTPSPVTDYPFLVLVEAVDSLGSVFLKRYRLDVAVPTWPDGVVSSAGGTVQDLLFGSSAEFVVPPAVFPASTNVAIHVVNPMNFPLPTGFSATASYYVEILLTPQPSFPLASPGVTVVLPLLTSQTPGSSLSLYFVDQSTGMFVPALDASGNPITGTVDAGGLTATFAGVVHFSTLVALKGSPKANQSISLNPIGAKTFGDPPFTVTAAATSGLAVSLAVAGSCTISGNTVTITGAGSCTVTASQGGSPNFNPAPSVSTQISIAKASATLTIASLTALFDGTAKSVVVTTNPSGLTGVSVTYDGSAQPPVGPGSFSVVASLTNPNYQAPNATGQLVIATPPVIVPTITGTAGANGWYTSNVTVSWSVTDPKFGITSSTGCGSTTLTTNTPGTTLTCSATNGAGLSNSVPVTIKIDQTAPVVVPTITGTAGTNGWYTSNVTVSWSVTDPESAIASSTGCALTSVTTNTPGTTLTCSATNGAGLSNSVSVTMKIDQTAPVVVPTITGPAGSNGWYTSNVTVSWSSTDPESGITSSTGCASTSLTTTTPGTTLTCSATNGAGLSNSVPVTIKIDQTAPVVVPTITGTAGTNGWYTSNVPVSWSVTDPESGIASSTGCASTNLTTNTAGATLTCSATNGAGLSNSVSAIIKIDTSRPVINPSVTPAPNAAGWNNSNATVAWSVTDPVSGVASSTGCAPTTVSTETTGTVFTCSATNGAGSSSAASLNVRLDKTAPVASNVRVVPAQLYISNSTSLTATLTDSGGSNLASAQYNIDGGSFIAFGGTFGGSTANVSATTPAFTATGVHNLCVRGTDVAGNVGATSCTTVAVFTAAAPSSSTTCNGAYNGTFNGSIIVSNGQVCDLEGTVTGAVTQHGGTLILLNATIGGAVQVTSGGNFTINASTIGGSLQVTSLPTSTGVNQVCGTHVKSSLQVTSNGAAVHVGEASGCAGNTIDGSLQVTSNSAQTLLIGNHVGGALQDNSNVTTSSPATQVTSNIITGALQCSGNSSIVGGGNTASVKQGQCSTF